MNRAEPQRGRIVIVSGPSGAGKTTVLKRVLAAAPQPLVRSVSATTRPPRPGETDGAAYHFLTAEEFERRRQAGAFLECFQVYGQGHWYGTLRSEVEAALAAGKWVVLEIDVKGAMAVAQQFPESVTIFVAPSSRAELERRLRDRGTETEEAIQRRLRQADLELAQAGRYRYCVANDDLDAAVQAILNILSREGEVVA